MKKSKLFGVFAAVALVVALIPLASSSGTEKSGSVVLSKDNVIVLNSEVNGESVSSVIAKAKELDVSLSGKFKGRLGLTATKPIYLFLNTPGGSIQAGLEMIEALEGLGRPVHTITLFSASMGFQIAQSLGDRLILKNGVLMSHHAAGEFAGAFGGVAPSQVDSRYKLWLDRVREMDEQTVKRTNGKQTYDSYTKQYDHEMWLTGTKSVEQGYADKIVTVKCDESLVGVSTHHINFFGLDVMYDLDNCPINTSPMNVRISAPGANTLLTATQIAEAKTKFLESFDKKAKQVVPMYW